jgi:predicted nucleotidyltransferase
MLTRLDITWFHKFSDIDIAVEGLDPAKYFQAYLQIEKIMNGEPFHLIDIKDIYDEFKAKIREKGRLL